MKKPILIFSRVFLPASTFLFALFLSSPSYGNPIEIQETAQPSWEVPETSESVIIDGILDEEAWQDAVMIELRYEIDPGENTPANVRTECFLISDEKNFYVAFHAYDPDPSKIRAHYMDRDLAWDDDWVMIALDPFKDERRAFQLLVNPLGVQMDDILNEVGSGSAIIDSTWDAIWDSAGQITDDGYIVEMAIPFTSIRFPRGNTKQRWGFQLLRQYPRQFAYFFRVTPWNRNRDCTLCEDATLIGFEKASSGINLEFDPTITSHRTDARSSVLSGPLERGDTETDLGLSARWGITPNISFNGAINPDFSQVEADVAQLGVNIRFALFYPEKRPFFLEGSDLFETMFRIVHTRTIVDPSWGTKITGKEQKHAFGVLVTEDNLPSILIPSNGGSRYVLFNENITTTIARYRFDLGKRSTLGALITNRDGEEYYNKVFGLDGVFQLSSADSISAQFLSSKTSYPHTSSPMPDYPLLPFDGYAYAILYLHEARDWNWWAGFEDVDRDFRADAGFLPRVDTITKMLGLQRIVWGGSESWFRNFSIYGEGKQVENEENMLTDRWLSLVGEISGPLQSTLTAGLVNRKELFNEVLYDQDYFHYEFIMRPTKSLSLSLSGKMGDAIDYHNSRPADLFDIRPGVGYFFGRRLQVRLDHLLQRLDVDEGRLFEANLTESRIIYQFNARTFVRAIVQYLDLDRNLSLYITPPQLPNRELLTQLLFSYKINPQTLLFVGYSDNRFGAEEIDMTQQDRTFFIKLGYAWVL